ncbi:phosphonate metabolism transcriptional regulator PhnF [Pannonibacter sp.]|uniref:phosphonate metabolism transcriptional regulator PhnF n=1 Tax=Pannonibacter sp. TaxID=1906786 RepID=UPI003F6EFDA2
MARETWQTIRDRLAAEILSGALAPGAQLPTEPDLCARFAAGRHSVRRAIAALAVEGKLRVEQGRGTFVESAPLINYQISRRTRFRQNLLSQGVTPAGEQVTDDVIPAPRRVADALSLPEGTSVHRLMRRGLADGVPVSLGVAYHPFALFPDMADLRRSGRSVTDIYRSHGIADYLRKSTTIYARRPTVEEARLLKQHPDQPVLVVTKTDVDLTGRPIGYSQAIWAADRVQFTFDLPEENEIRSPDQDD